MIHKPGSGYLKSDWYRRFIDKPVPTLFSMADAKQHAIRRKLFSRAFSKSEIRTRWEPMVKQTAELALDNICRELASGEVNILKWWLSMAADVSVHLMFGESFRILENGEVSSPERQRLDLLTSIQVNNYFRVLQLAGMGGAIADELPLVGFIGRRIPHPTIRDVFKSNDYLIDFGEKAVMNSMKYGKDSTSIFAQLETFDSTGVGEGARPLTSLDLSVEAGNFILAGTDTTGFTLTCLVWAVLRQPAIQSALEKEVAALEDGFTDTQLEELPLLNAVINETLRLYGPASSSLPRMVPQGGAQLGGYFIPENVTVSTQAWTLHRDEQFWSDSEK